MISNSSNLVVKNLPSGTIYKRSDGLLILRQSIDKDCITVDELKEQLSVFLEIQKDEKSPFLIVVNKLSKLNNEEKIFINETVEQFANKICIVAKTPFAVFLFNIAVFLKRPSIPVKIVTNEGEGLEWLMKN